MIETVCRFNNEGGPLILLPREVVTLWEGNDPPSAGRVVIADSRWDDQEAATDYDRACDVLVWAEILDVGTHSWGLVLPEDAGVIALLPFDEVTDSFVLIRALSSDVGTVNTDLRSRGGAEWTELSESLTIGDGSLFLMHGASRGDEAREVAWGRTAQVGTAQVIRVPTGSYRLEQYSIPNDDGSEAEVVYLRFQRQDAMAE